MLRRDFTKILPAALVAPASLLAPSTSEAAWPPNLEIAFLAPFPHLFREELPSLTGVQCHVVQPNGMMTSSSTWHYNLIEEDSVLKQRREVIFGETGVTIDQFRELIGKHGAPMFELRITCIDADEVLAFVPEEDVHAAIDRLEACNEAARQWHDYLRDIVEWRHR